MRTVSAVLLAVASLAATRAAAQTTFRFGLRGGGQLAWATLATPALGSEYLPERTGQRPLLAWQAGAVLEAHFGRLALQPALVFSQKDSKITAAGSWYNALAYSTLNRFEAQVTTHTNWLELPLNLVYTAHGDHGFQVFAGPYVAVGLGRARTGTVTLSSTIDAANLPSVRSLDAEGNNGGDYRRLDAGVGYRRGPWQVQTGYGLGLLNAYSGEGQPASHNREPQFTATYFVAH